MTSVVDGSTKSTPTTVTPLPISLPKVTDPAILYHQNQKKKAGALSKQARNENGIGLETTVTDPYILHLIKETQRQEKFREKHQKKQEKKQEYTYVIRKAIDLDVQASVLVINSAFAHAYSHVRPKDSPAPRTSVEQVLNQITEQGCALLLCENRRKEIVGTIIYPSPHVDFDSMEEDATSSFGSLAVWPLTEQKNGIGRMLIEEVEKLAKEQDMTKIECCYAHGPLLNNKPNLDQFYQQLGYRKGVTKQRTKWYDILPEYREGLYFQQMRKDL
jgi:predicted N-acetyltransferase YhbS